MSSRPPAEPHAHPATPPVAPGVERRQLLRGGAVLAGVAGVTALAALQPPTATAADGDPFTLGEANEATVTTELRIGPVTTGNQTDAALALDNADGPSLALQPLAADWDGDLAVGQITNTRIGPSIGVDDPDGSPVTSFLATEFDLLAVPRPVPTRSPVRLVDTRQLGAAARANIIGSSANAFDSAGRLRGSAYMDVAVEAADLTTINLTSVFLNLTVTGGLAGGFLTAYRPPEPLEEDRPNASTLNYAKGQTIANAAFVGLTVLDSLFAVRIFVSGTTHVLVDLTGGTVAYEPGPDASAARKPSATARRARAARRAPKLLGRRR